MLDRTRIFIDSKGDLEGMSGAFRGEIPEAEILIDATEIGAEPVPFIVVGKPDPGIIKSIPGLELVLSLNAGVEHLLASGEVPEHLPIARLVDPAMTMGMSDWVLAVVLSWHRNLAFYRSDRAWTRRNERLSQDRTVTVLGAGVLGGRVAHLLALVGFRTRVWSRSGSSVEGAEAFASADGLIAATTGADVVVNLLPLTEATRDVLAAPLFARMVEGGLVVNAGRGAHLVDADLIAALDAGHLDAAALDVFRTEPLPETDPLWRHPSILVTPHVAAPTQPGSAIRIMAENIRKHQRGEAVRYLVDRGQGY